MSRPRLPSKVQALKDSLAAAEVAVEVVAAPQDTPDLTVPVPDPVAEVVADPVPILTGEPDLVAENTRLKAELSAMKQRHDVLHGKYNAEVPVLHRQVRDLSDDVITLTTKLSARAAPPKPTEPNTPPEGERSDEDVLGPEAVAAIKRMTEAAVAPVVESVAKNANEKFQVSVETFVPDWYQLEAHEAFDAWLSEAHPDTGYPRGVNLKNAINRHDVQVTAHIYNQFKRSVGLPVFGDTPAAAPASIVKPLSERIAPSGAQAASTPAIAQATVYTLAEVTAFYRDYAQRKAQGVHGKEKLALEAKERDITLAASQGRIRRG